MFFVDVWEPEGTDIRQTRNDTLEVAEFLRQQPGVVQTTSVIGGGATRYTLVYEPKEDAASYAQIIVRTENNELVHAGETLPIIPGMVASVDILTGEKTVLDYLLKPVLKARNRALTER